MEIKKNKKVSKKWSVKYCADMMRETNLEQEYIIKIASVIFLGVVVAGSLLAMFKMDDEDYLSIRVANEKNVIMSEQQIYEEVKLIQEKFDTSNWKKYQSDWYGFNVKYPDNINAPIVRNASADSKWEYRYEFRKKEIDDNPFIGFNIAVYNVNKTKELMNIAEFPAIKSEELKRDPWCESIYGRIIETGDYPAEEIYIPPSDKCYNSTLFFTFTRGEYMYTFIPVVKEDFERTGDPRIEINDKFPEFLAIISTSELIDIKRSRVSTSKSISPMPTPVSYKRIEGKLVCAKKNDHPSKSDQNKKKHLDMECCLDPDEYPNPHCYYSPDKYGKYLK